MTEFKNQKSFFTVGLKCLCPRCCEGKLFKNPNPYNFKTLADMPATCTVCNLSFMPETGFYYGAMYMSYALCIFLSVLNFAWVYALWGWVIWPYLITNAVILLALLPVIFRLSRSFYLAAVFRFEKSTARFK